MIKGVATTVRVLNLIDLYSFHSTKALYNKVKHCVLADILDKISKNGSLTIKIKKIKKKTNPHLSNIISYAVFFFFFDDDSLDFGKKKKKSIEH